MGIVTLILYFIGFFAFFQKQKYFTLIIIVVLASSYFRLANPNFFIGPFSFQHSDFALLLIFSLLPFRKKLNNSEIDGIRKSMLFFFMFLAISIFYDYFVRGTTAMQIFRTTRKIGFLAFFFLLNSFNERDYKKFLNFFIIATLFHTILYISQYVFRYSLTGNFSINELGGARYGNSPPYIIPVLVVALFTFSNKIVNRLLIILLFIAILLTLSRGAIVSALSIILLYMFFIKKMRLQTLIFISLLLFVSYNLSIIYFPIIGDRFSSLFNQIDKVGDMNYNNLQTYYHEGSLLFRMALTYERFMYVIHKPVRIILGVGYVPDMDITSPIFILGTHSPTLPTGFEQYNSADILFPNIITRYGLVGSFIFLYFIFQFFKFSFKNKDLLWGQVLFTYLFSLLFISLVSETFYNSEYFLFIFMLMGLIIKSGDKYIPNLLQNKLQ